MLRGVDGKLTSDCPVWRFSAGEFVPTTVDGDAVLCIVLVGALRVTSRAAHGAFAADAARDSKEVFPGDCVGEHAILGGDRRGIAITALQETDVLVIDADTLWEMIDKSSGFARNLLIESSIRQQASNAAVRRRQARREHFHLMELADRDSSLRSRSWLDDHLSGIVSKASLAGMPLSVLLIGLDYIDHFVDVYDQLALAEALRTVGNVLIGSLRAIDCAAHYDSDSVIVILPSANTQEAGIVAERLGERMQKAVVFADMRESLPHITASFGVASLVPGQEASDLILSAIVALDRARKSGMVGIAGRQLANYLD
jgi:diguanylate cyclase (GGDEF)-like protein